MFVCVCVCVCVCVSLHETHIETFPWNKSVIGEGEWRVAGGAGGGHKQKPELSVCAGSSRHLNLRHTIRQQSVATVACTANAKGTWRQNDNFSHGCSLVYISRFTAYRHLHLFEKVTNTRQ